MVVSPLAQELVAAAQQQLAIRKGELLGNPQIPLIADRPEHTVGLVQALEDLEEERNQSLLSVDYLRRAIKAASDARATAVERLNQLVSRLPEPQARLSQNVK